MADITTVYKRGSKGDEVGKIQTALGSFYGGEVDNDYGPITKDAVLAWQTQWNTNNPNDQIKIDGKVGKETYPRLMQWSAQQGQQAAGTPGATTAATPVSGNQDVQSTPTVKPEDYMLTEGQMIERFGTNPATGTDQVSTPETGQDGKKATPQTHIFDWSSKTLEDVMSKDGKKTPTYNIIYDYMTWCQENGVPYNPFAINDIINKTPDLQLTPEAAAAAKAKEERKEKWDKVGNFLQHLGNAIGNVASGGYGSVQLEDPVQWSERKRMLKEKTEQQRKANNMSLWEQMRKERQAQREYEIKKQQAEALATYRNQQAQAAKQKADDNSNVQNAKVAYLNTKTGAIEMKTPAEIEKLNADAQRSRQQGNAAMMNAGTNRYNSENPVNEERTVTEDVSKGTKSYKVNRSRGGRSRNTSGNTGKTTSRTQL